MKSCRGTARARDTAAAGPELRLLTRPGPALQAPRTPPPPPAQRPGSIHAGTCHHMPVAQLVFPGFLSDCHSVTTLSVGPYCDYQTFQIPCAADASLLSVVSLIQRSHALRSPHSEHCLVLF